MNYLTESSPQLQSKCEGGPCHTDEEHLAQTGLVTWPRSQLTLGFDLCSDGCLTLPVYMGWLQLSHVESLRGVLPTQVSVSSVPFRKELPKAMALSVGSAPLELS